MLEDLKQRGAGGESGASQARTRYLYMGKCQRHRP